MTEIEELETGNSDLSFQTYVQQWNNVIKIVVDNEAHLLDDFDWECVKAFRSVSDEARLVFIRLMLRTRKVERVSRLSFTTDEICQELGKVNLIALDPLVQIDLETKLALLTRPELIDLAKLYRIPKPSGSTVPLLQKAIIDNMKAISTFSLSFKSVSGNKVNSAHEILNDRVNAVIGKCLEVPSNIYECFFRLFIIHNRDRNWPDNPFLPHILTNLQANPIVYNRYKITRIPITWPTRQDLISYIDMMKLHHQVDSLRETLNGSTPVEERDATEMQAISLCQTCIPIFNTWVSEFPNEGHVSGIPWLASFTAGMKAMSILKSLASIYSRRSGFEADACNIFDMLLKRKLIGVRRGRGDLWDDYMKLLVRMGNLPEAYDCGCDALTDTAVEFGVRRTIEARLVKLGKKLGVKDPIIALHSCSRTLQSIYTRTVYTQKTFSATGKKAIYKDLETNEELQVEKVALNEFERMGFKGVHCENTIVTTFFGILFWDILFDSSVPGVFVTPFQDAPLDLNTEFFYSARKDAIDARLADLRKFPETHHVKIISKIDELHRPCKTVCRGVNWDVFSRDDLLELASCFTGTQFARICEAFIKSYGAHRGGVPDLCVWNAATKEVKLVEVKGQGDHLSHSQIMWLDLFTSIGIDVELFRVQLSVKRKR